MRRILGMKFVVMIGLFVGLLITKSQYQNFVSSSYKMLVDEVVIKNSAIDRSSSEVQILRAQQNFTQKEWMLYAGDFFKKIKNEKGFNTYLALHEKKQRARQNLIDYYLPQKLKEEYLLNPHSSQFDIYTQKINQARLNLESQYEKDLQALLKSNYHAFIKLKNLVQDDLSAQSLDI